MDLCFKLNYSFIWKRHSRKGKNVPPLAHTHAHVRTHILTRNSQYYLDRDLCNFKPSHSSISLSSRANRRIRVCQRSLYQSPLLTVSKGVLQWSILVFGVVRGLSKWVGVSAHHYRKPTHLWLCEAAPTTQRENWISSDGYQTYSKSWQLFVD